jgi:hypothetical protein
MSPVELHDEIEKLPTFHADAESTDAKLADLANRNRQAQGGAHDLMNAANSNDQETVKDKLADFESAGSNLGNFYNSLSSKSSRRGQINSDTSGSDKSSSDKSTDTKKKE